MKFDTVIVTAFLVCCIIAVAIFAALALDGCNAGIFCGLGGCGPQWSGADAGGQ